MLNENDALYDYINITEGQLIRYSQKDNSDDDFRKSIEGYIKEKKRLQETEAKAFIAVMQPNGRQAGIDYPEMKLEGFSVSPGCYDIVWCKNLPNIDNKYALVRQWHRECDKQPDFYGSHKMTIGDIIIIGNCAKAADVFFIASDCYRSVGHFITPGLERRLDLGITIKQELLLLQGLSEKDEYAESRKEYLQEMYPKLSLKKEKSLTVRHDKKFTDEEIYVANHTDLVDFLGSRGYTLKRIGSCYTTKEIDSVRIYNRTTYCRFSDQSGGSAVSWLEKIEGVSFVDAVKELLRFNGYSSEKPHEMSHRETPKPKVNKKEDRKEKTEDRLVLPEKAESFRQLYAYLTKTRHLDKATVDYFVREGLIYESGQHHNAVFVGKDKEGNIRHAFQRGTNSFAKEAFKRDVVGSDKNYGFNLTIPGSDRVVVTEAAIDLMSWYEAFDIPYGGIQTCGLALGGCADNPLERYLNEHPKIKEVSLWLDNDEAGDKGTQTMIEKYSQPEWKSRGIEVYDGRIKDEYKDMNERLAGWKEETMQMQKTKSLK